MSWGTAVEEGRVGVIDNLREREGLVLGAGSEGSVGGLVARSQLRRLGDGVVVGAPHEQDGVTDRGIDGERNVTENTLGRCDDDSVGSTAA